MSLQPTVPPKVLSKGHRRCTQIKCGFYQSGHCQRCKKGCNARPYEINPDCRHCIACEGEEGYLRFGDEELEERMGQVQQQKEDVIIISRKPERRMEKEIM